MGLIPEHNPAERDRICHCVPHRQSCDLALQAQPAIHRNGQPLWKITDVLPCGSTRRRLLGYLANHIKISEYLSGTRVKCRHKIFRQLQASKPQTNSTVSEIWHLGTLTPGGNLICKDLTQALGTPFCCITLPKIDALAYVNWVLCIQ